MRALELENSNKIIWFIGNELFNICSYVALILDVFPLEQDTDHQKRLQSRAAQNFIDTVYLILMGNPINSGN